MSWSHCTGDTVKQSQRRVTSPTSKMFGQHLKCCLTAPRRAGTSFGFFFCFFLLSQLSRSEPGRLGIALSGPASRLTSAMTFSGSEIDTSLTVDCCSFSICRTQSPEELEDGPVVYLANAFDSRLRGDLICLRGGEDSERAGDKILRWRHSNYTHCDACRRETA